MVKCSAYRCENATYKKTPGLTFYRFPKDERISNAWVTKIKLHAEGHRQDWQPNPSSLLCSKHFESHFIDISISRTRLRFQAIPTIFDELPLTPQRLSSSSGLDITQTASYKEDQEEHISDSPRALTFSWNRDCHACHKNINGSRFVCVQCDELDLCGACEAAGHHPLHYLLRVPNGPRPECEVQSVVDRVRHLLKEFTAIQTAAEVEVLQEPHIIPKVEVKSETDPLDMDMPPLLPSHVMEQSMFDVSVDIKAEPDDNIDIVENPLPHPDTTDNLSSKQDVQKPQETTNNAERPEHLFSILSQNAKIARGIAEPQFLVQASHYSTVEGVINSPQDLNNKISAQQGVVNVSSIMNQRDRNPVTSLVKPTRIVAPSSSGLATLSFSGVLAPTSSGTVAPSTSGIVAPSGVTQAEFSSQSTSSGSARMKKEEPEPPPAKKTKTGEDDRSNSFSDFTHCLSNTEVFKMGKTNAEHCKNYYNRKKAAEEAEKIRQGFSVEKPIKKTGAERTRAYRLRKIMLSQANESSVTDISSIPSTSNSRIRTFEPSFQLATTSASTNRPDVSTVSSTADHDDREKKKETTTKKKT